MVFLLICFQCLIVLSSSTSFCNRDLSSLSQLIVLFRHGDRNPEGTFPTDRYKEDSWPLGWAQLTPQGVLKQYNFGKWIKDCYGSFLTDTLSTQNVYVRSSDVDRTLMSAQAHLAGVYPPSNSQQWGKSENISLGRLWQPFPVHTVPVMEDSLLKANQNCVRFAEGVEDAYNSSYVKDIEEKDSAVLKFLGSKSGLNTTSLHEITKGMCDSVIIEMLNNLTLVEWLQNDTLTDKLKEYQDLSFQLSYNQPEQAKLHGGPLLANIVDYMVNYSLPNVSNTFKHILYSAHDTTVAAILSSLGDFNNIAPPFAAAVIFELHNIGNDSFRVQVFYRNVSDSTVDPYKVAVSNCSENEMGCALNQFITATSRKISRTHATDCLSGRSLKPQPLDFRTVTIVVAVTAGLVVVTIAVACLLKFLRRGPSEEFLIEESNVN